MGQRVLAADGAPSHSLLAAGLFVLGVITSCVLGIALAAHFGDGQLRADDIAAGLLGTVVQDPVTDAVAWNEYLETVVRDRDGWDDLYRACRDISG